MKLRSRTIPDQTTLFEQDDTKKKEIDSIDESADRSSSSDLRETKHLKRKQTTNSDTPTMKKQKGEQEVETKDDSPKKIERITKTRAKQDFRLSDADLEGLDYITRPNPHYRSAAPMVLYILSEVEELGERKKAERQQKFEAQSEARRVLRSNQLSRANLSPESISDEENRKWIFGNFCDPSVSRPSRNITEIKKRYYALSLFSHLPEPLQNRKDILNVILWTGFKKKPAKKSFYEFLSPLLVKTFQKSEAFSQLLEGETVTSVLTSFLQKSDIANMRIAFEFSSRVTSALSSSMEMRTRHTAARMDQAIAELKALGVNDRVLSQAMSRMKDAPHHQYLGVESTYRHLMEQVKLTESQREQKLKERFRYSSASYRGDSTFCSAYVMLGTIACAEEVVSTLELASDLFECYGHRAYSECIDDWKWQMKVLVRDESISWTKAANIVMRRKKNINAANRASWRNSRW